MSSSKRGATAAPSRGAASPPDPPRRTRGEQVRFIAGRSLLFLVSVGLMGALGGVAGLATSLSKLPDVSTLATYVPHETSKIFDRRGRLLANVHGEENRVVIPLHDIPLTVQHAVIAMEDTDFYEHYGVNPKGITRAFLVNVAEGANVEGASTLTQQLAKNLFLEPAKTLPRKIAEAWLAIQIEHQFSKAQILEMYLNQVYWGHNAYGIEAASLHYFGKSTRKLNLAESAMLAGLLRGPEDFSPYRNPKGAKHLQSLVLQRMRLAGFINQQQFDTAQATELKHPGVTSYEYKVPWFTAYMIKELSEKYGSDKVLKGGLRVYTTLDLDLQLKAEKMVREYVETKRAANVHQAALVAIEPKTGFVRVVVGGTDFNKSKFNRAMQAQRPPGSTFKPFVYLTALSHGYAPGSVIVDEPTSFPAGPGVYYSPNNYDRRHRGPITMRKALESSVNIVAVKIGHAVGVNRVIDTAHALGIKSKLGAHLSLPLGTSEVTPFEMAAAYSVLANDGLRCEPTMVTKILDRDGRVIEEYKPYAKRVYDAQPVRLLVHMMQGVINHGTATAARIGRPAAGKTGTTSDARDVWFVGFTPDLATSVWMGNDDNSRLGYGATGGEVCAPLWAQFMREALKDTKASAFPKLKNITEATINRRTGKLTNPLDKEAVTEIFPAGQEPTEFQFNEAPSELELMTPKPAAPAPAVFEAAPPVPAPAKAKPKPKPQPPKRKPVEILTTDETLLEPAPDFPDGF